MGRRTLHLGAAATAAAVGVAMAAPAASADPATCPGNNVCFWNDYGYTGNRVIKGPSWVGQGWQFFDHTKLSVKNHFDNKYVCLKNGLGNVFGPVKPHEEVIFIGSLGASYFKVKYDSSCG